MPYGEPGFDEQAVIQALAVRLEDAAVAQVLWQSAARRVGAATPVRSWEDAHRIAAFLENTSSVIRQEVARPLRVQATLNKAFYGLVQ